jgi:hypothetical protein
LANNGRIAAQQTQMISKKALTSASGQKGRSIFVREIWVYAVTADDLQRLAIQRFGPTADFNVVQKLSLWDQTAMRIFFPRTYGWAWRNVDVGYFSSSLDL